MVSLYWKACKVCHRDIDWDEVRSVQVRAALHGHVAYGICICGMEAKNAKDPNYRRRWRRAEKELRKKRKESGR